ncbi:MAG: histidine phosphatase family protein [Kineosporiaceae bacterium]
MSTTVVHLLRHAEVHNPTAVLYGRLPGFHLSERGTLQAERAAEHLAALTRDCGVAALLTSPLERARETAAPVAAALGVAPVVDDRLLESANDFQGEGLAFRAAYLAPAYWRRYGAPWRPSWGEPYTRVADRITAVVDELRRAHPGRHVVCVSHQAPIWVTRRRLEGRPLWHDPRRRQCGLASLTSLAYDGDDLVGVSYACPAADA